MDWPSRPRPGEHPAPYLSRVGIVFATFDRQDSGNISYGVELPAGERYFVKTAGDPLDAKPFLEHGSRVELLRNAARLASGISHPLLPEFHGVLESVAGPILVYDWADGELVGVPRVQRADPASPYQRFRALAPARGIQAIDAIVDLHERLAAQGWIASDFYDGCLIYDFTMHSLAVIDLDAYHQGEFTNTMGRMFGSTRFMAPEEFERGATIDQRTTVFTLGRTGALFLPDCPSALQPVLARSCRPRKEDRYPTVTAFARAWRAAACGWT